MGKAINHESKEKLVEGNLMMNDKLKNLRSFLGPQIINQQMPNYTYEDTYMYDERVEFDENGEVFKVIIKPYKSDTFSKEQLTDEKEGLLAMAKRKLIQASILKLSLKDRKMRHPHKNNVTMLSRWT